MSKRKSKLAKINLKCEPSGRSCNIISKKICIVKYGYQIMDFK